ncbi:WD40 repeat-like protein [Pilatotrama ljubarskyi]|nr:WD40 repeat-like protein [Pilatotrama ljubarskyi]
MPEYIDVDDLSDPLSDDAEIVLTGFKRDPAKSKLHIEQLDAEGFVYTGFNETPNPRVSGTPLEAVRIPATRGTSSKTPESDQQPSASMVQLPLAGGANLPLRSEIRAKRAPSASDAGPPVKRQKHTHQSTAMNSHLKRDHAAMRATSRNPPVSAEVIYISDSEDEQPPPKKATLCKSPNMITECRGRDVRVAGSARPREPLPEPEPLYQDPMDIDRQEEADYATAHAALDLDYGPNWEAVDDRDDRLHDVNDEEANEDGLARHMAALSVAQSTKHPVLDNIRHRQQQSTVFSWPESADLSRKPPVWSMGRQAVYTSRPRSRGWRWQDDFSQWMGLRPRLPMRLAPGNINTIIQHKGLIVVASAVADGAIDGKKTLDYSASPCIPRGETTEKAHWWFGPKGKLMSWMDIVPEAAPRLVRQGPRHHFTVNDVAINPSRPTQFASAGRDRRVLVWDCEPIHEGASPVIVEEIECEDNPEVVKYHPGGTMLAVQCDDGSVDLHTADTVTKAVIAPARLGHVTAEMAWGLHSTENILFASSARLDDARGFHKAFDVERHEMVVEFDAAKEGCSTLALDPAGERLFIATEGPESVYALRQFDARRRERKASQKVQLEPFVDISDRSAMAINSLSLSSDGIYIAAGRTDNWVDVYDSRMLAKGPLYNFAHEGDVGNDTFGVVKTQWVDGMPYGVGLVSGGIDGCVRLWDVRRSSDDPLNGTILAQGDYDVGTFALGDIYRGHMPIIVYESPFHVRL